MAPHAVGPRRTDSLRTYLRATRIVGGLSVPVLIGAIAWDLANDGFWARHASFTGLVASLIVVAVSAAVLNAVLERRQRERWSVLAQYALFEFVRAARLVWSGLLELAGLVPEGELGDEALAADPRNPNINDGAFHLVRRHSAYGRLASTLRPETPVTRWSSDLRQPTLLLSRTRSHDAPQWDGGLGWGTLSSPEVVLAKHGLSKLRSPQPIGSAILRKLRNVTRRRVAVSELRHLEPR